MPILCIGVWDTVGALGVPRNRWTRRWHPCAETYRFLDTRLGAHVTYAFQAMAIDEKREPYQPVLWNQEHDPLPHQDIRQVWFAGVHADIGGGYDCHGAADIPFIWMAAQVAGLLDLDAEALQAELDTRQEYGRATLHETFKGFWKMAGSRHRTIGPGANQFVHDTALGRCGADGYPRNPVFDFQARPVWQSDAFERRHAWDKTAWPPEPRPLPGRPLTVCDKAIRWLEGTS